MEKALSMIVPEKCKLSLGALPSVRLGSDDDDDESLTTDKQTGATEGLLDHVDEGPDDITGHVKASLLGANLTIPITKGRLALGTWQVGSWVLVFNSSVNSRFCPSHFHESVDITT